jgi:hypothetical protein
MEIRLAGSNDDYEKVLRLGHQSIGAMHFLVAQLLRQPLLHADETGIRIDKTLNWLHCLSNDKS